MRTVLGQLVPILPCPSWALRTVGRVQGPGLCDQELSLVVPKVQISCGINEYLAG